MSEVPDVREFNDVVYRLAATYKGHGADDEFYARNEANAIRRFEKKKARVVRYNDGDVVRWCVYTAERGI